MATMAQVPANQKVWVGNLSADTAVEDVDAHFRQLGEPLGVELVRNGVACVAYSTADEAETAVAAFNGSEIGENVIETDAWSAKMGAKGKAKGGNVGAQGPATQQKGVYGNKGAAMGGKGAWAAAPVAAAPYGNKGAKSAFGGVASPYGNKGAQPAFGGVASPYGNKGAQPAFGGVASPYGSKGGKPAFGGVASPYGNKGGKGVVAPSFGGAGAAPAKAAQCFHINVGDNTLTQQGYGPEAPAIVYEKGNDVFSCGTHILNELGLEDIAAEVEILDDADWEQFPEIGEALKAASGEEHCFAVGICASRSKWALGVAYGGKHRASAVKIAMAVALAMEDPTLAGTVAKNYPEFAAILRGQGMKVAAGAAGGAAGWGKKKQAGLGQADWEEPTLSGETPKAYMVSLTQESALTTEGYPADAPAVLHGGKAEKAYFSNAHTILSELIEDVSEVQFQDDPESDTLPEVRAALTEAGAEENGQCVVTCPSLAVWGIGLAWGKKTRESAGKMALAIAIAQAQGKIETLAATYPEFGVICSALGLYTAAPASKKMRR